LDDCNSVSAEPGTITRISKDGVFVACKDKEIKILKIQVPGKKVMFVKDYLNGIDKNKLIGKRFV
jgi:methionyl-tRNA formyltransferase